MILCVSSCCFLLFIISPFFFYQIESFILFFLAFHGVWNSRKNVSYFSFSLKYWFFKYFNFSAKNEQNLNIWILVPKTTKFNNLKINAARFARKVVKWDLFVNFQNSVSFATVFPASFLLLVFPRRRRHSLHWEMNECYYSLVNRVSQNILGTSVKLE